MAGLMNDGRGVPRQIVRPGVVEAASILLAAATNRAQAAEVRTMKTATVRMVSWLLVLALTAPLAAPAAASSSYVNRGGG